MSRSVWTDPKTASDESSHDTGATCEAHVLRLVSRSLRKSLFLFYWSSAGTTPHSSASLPVHTPLTRCSVTPSLVPPSPTCTSTRLNSCSSPTPPTRLARLQSPGGGRRIFRVDNDSHPRGETAHLPMPHSGSYVVLAEDEYSHCGQIIKIDARS